MCLYFSEEWLCPLVLYDYKYLHLQQPVTDSYQLHYIIYIMDNRCHRTKPSGMPHNTSFHSVPLTTTHCFCCFTIATIDILSSILKLFYIPSNLQWGTLSKWQPTLVHRRFSPWSLIGQKYWNGHSFWCKPVPNSVDAYVHLGTSLRPLGYKLVSTLFYADVQFGPWLIYTYQSITLIRRCSNSWTVECLDPVTPKTVIVNGISIKARQ